ncbi:MAG: hypothetical protein AB7F22_33195 [Reyranella sp.]|uniref:hypothetical protein n=1 Tax=Reyranella sp. TaxID=1929291 RepID=UPI003D0E5FD9
MLNLAIALAFLVSIALSPGQRLFSLLVGTMALHFMQPGQRGVLLAVAGYWLPAALFYLALRWIPRADRARPTRTESRVLGVCVATLITYVVARTIATSVPGGGLILVVAPFALVALPAMIVAAVVVLRVMARLFRPDESEALRPPLRPFEIAAIVLVGFGPVAMAFGSLFVGASRPVPAGRDLEERMSTLCATAGERLMRSPLEGKGVFLDVDQVWRFDGVDDGKFRNYGTSEMYPPVTHSGVLQFYERPSHNAGRVAGATRYERFSEGKKSQSVDELISRYGVFRTQLTTEKDLLLGLVGGDLVIKDLQSGEIIATSRFFANTKSREICGTATNERIDEREFILRALQSQPP